MLSATPPPNWGKQPRYVDIDLFNDILIFQPTLPPEQENIDYDSSASDDEEQYIDYEDDEDVFKEPKVIAATAHYIVMYYILSPYLDMLLLFLHFFQAIFIQKTLVFKCFWI